MKTLTKKLKKYPKEDLSLVRNGKYLKWYINEQAGLTYLPKSKRKLAEKLAEKLYIKEQIAEINQEIIAIDKYLKYHNQIKRNDKLLLDYPGINELLIPYFEAENTKTLNWSKTEFNTNPVNSEQLNIETKSGIMVRSKSEAVIASVLYENNIAFKYEAELLLNDGSVYPDFSILHPKSGKIIYWEHFGMMDSSLYYQKAYSKLMLYAVNNIIPDINLIVTYETSKHPLSVIQVERKVEEFLL